MGRFGLLLLNGVQALFLAVWSAFWITLAVIVSVFSSELPLVMARRFWAPGLIWAAGAKMEVAPGAQLDKNGTYVFVMNHQSSFDIPVAFRYISCNLRFVLKQILFFVPFIGLYCWRTKMIFIDRSNPKRAYRSLERAKKRIGGGISIIAYPEGTRRLGPVGKLRRGPFVLAQGAGVPVVPVAIEGSGHLLRKSTFSIHPGTVVRLKIGEPISTAGYTESREDIDRLRDRVSASLSDLHQSIGGPAPTVDIETSTSSAPPVAATVSS